MLGMAKMCGCGREDGNLVYFGIECQVLRVLETAGNVAQNAMDNEISGVVAGILVFTL